MDVTNSAVWFTVSFVLISAVAIKIAKGRIMFGSSRCTMPTPPVVDGISLIRFIIMVLTKGLRATIHDQHKRMGSVFTISFFGLKLTFLVGPENLSRHFQGPDSEISHGNMLEFMLPMFGKGVGYGVDFTTRYEQIRFYSDALTRPSKLRVHVGPMIQEVEVCIINYCAHIFKPSDYFMYISFLEENLFFAVYCWWRSEVEHC